MGEQLNQRRIYKGDFITKWNPTNRYYSEKGELIFGKAVEKSSFISTNNHFEDLCRQEQVEEKG